MKLIASYTKVEWLLPEKSLHDFKQDIASLGIEVREYENLRKNVVFWKPHSAIDEMDFMVRDLKNLSLQGVSMGEIAIYVPNDAFYKRILRAKAAVEWRADF